MNERLDVLQIDNKSLNEKIEYIKKENNIENYIETLDNSLKENLNNLKESFLISKNDELENLRMRMKEIKIFYDDFEKNYIHLLKNITEFKEVEFEKKINMIINENFCDILGNNNQKFKSNNNLNVNINNFNNITLHDDNSNLRNILINKGSIVIENNNKNTKIDKSNIDLSSKNRDVLSDCYENTINCNVKNNNTNKDRKSISPINNKAGKKFSFGNKDTPQKFLNQVNKNSVTVNAITNYIKNNYEYGNNNDINNKINIQNKNSSINEKVKDNRYLPKKGKTKREENRNTPNVFSNYFIKEKTNKKLSINHKNSDKDNYILDDNKNKNFKSKNSDNEFYLNFKGNTDNVLEKNINKHLEDEKIYKLIKSEENPSYQNTNIIFDSNSNMNINYSKNTNISEAIKNIQITKNNFEIPEIGYVNEDKNLVIGNNTKFGGILENFNFNCEELFKKIEMHINSKNRVDYNDFIILSYKKLFLSNKTYSIKIFDEFLKKKEDYKIDLINRPNKISFDHLLNRNLFHSNDEINNYNYDKKEFKNTLFLQESNNNIQSNMNIVNEDYLKSPDKFGNIPNDINEKSHKEKNKLKDSDKIFLENNFSKNKSNNFSCFNFDKASKPNNCYNNNIFKSDNCFNDENSEIFLKMKNCIIKLMLKIIYFENMNYDLLNKLSIDLSNIFYFYIIYQIKK